MWAECDLLPLRIRPDRSTSPEHDETAHSQTTSHQEIARPRKWRPAGSKSGVTTGCPGTVATGNEVLSVVTSDGRRTRSEPSGLKAGRMGHMNKHQLDILEEGYSACLFDLDGVLTDTAVVHADAWKHLFDEVLSAWAGRHGKAVDNFDPVKDFQEYVAGHTPERAIRDFLASRSIMLPEGAISDSPNDLSVHGLAARHNALALQQFQERGVQVFDGSLRFLYLIRRSGLKTAVVSSDANAGAILKAARIDNFFDTRVDATAAAQAKMSPKPSPDMLIEATRRLGVSPATTAVLEDSVVGVRAAYAGHFGLVIGVDRFGSKEQTLLDNGANMVIRDLDELIKQ
jgi:HAD superfamily hydrolase (TIGR01509 family)